MTNEKEDAQAAAERAATDAIAKARPLTSEAERTVEHDPGQLASLKDDLVIVVRNRPLRALGIAVALGFALGAIYKA